MRVVRGEAPGGGHGTLHLPVHVPRQTRNGRLNGCSAAVMVQGVDEIWWRSPTVRGSGCFVCISKSRRSMGSHVDLLSSYDVEIPLSHATHRVRQRTGPTRASGQSAEYRKHGTLQFDIYQGYGNSRLQSRFLWNALLRMDRWRSTGHL